MGGERLVVDASVVLKWFHKEEETLLALELQSLVIDGSITAFVPDLLLYEVANAIIRGFGKTDEEVYKALRILLDLPWDIVSPSVELLSSAARLAAKQRNLSVYDAMYVAVALQHRARVVTADKKLHKLVGLPSTILLEDFDLSASGK